MFLGDSLAHALRSLSNEYNVSNHILLRSHNDTICLDNVRSITATAGGGMSNGHLCDDNYQDPWLNSVQVVFMTECQNTKENPWMDPEILIFSVKKGTKLIQNRYVNRQTSHKHYYYDKNDSNNRIN